jgi:hypothetical protein
MNLSTYLVCLIDIIQDSFAYRIQYTHCIAATKTKNVSIDTAFAIHFEYQLLVEVQLWSMNHARKTRLKIMFSLPLLINIFLIDLNTKINKLYQYLYMLSFSIA